MNFKDFRHKSKGKRENIKNLPYRPNHVYGRGRNGRTAQVAAERGTLGTGGPRLVLPHLHVIILKEQGDYLKEI
jgi:hypothetical protein